MFTSPGSRTQIKRPSLARLAYRQYWTRQYHSLSPGAYVANSGVSQTWTVPADRAWYMVNGWQININGTGLYYHRSVDCNFPLELPPGTVVTTTGGGGQLYYFDPKLVPTPDDPESAYYARLARLTNIPLQLLTANIAAAQPPATQATVAFPATFTNGIIRGLSTFDLAWTIFEPIGYNFDLEVSDAHQIRYGRTIMVPFVRSVLTGIRIQAASISGDGVQTSLAGRSVVAFQPLPVDW